MGVCCEGVKGARADFVCFHCPLVATAAAKPHAAHKQIRIEKSSHKTHLIQPIRRVRCVSYAKYATEKGRHTRRYTAP